MKTIAVMTGGGDCPGMNAAIRAVVRAGSGSGYQTFGVRNGWPGLIHDDLELLTDLSVSGILMRGGTILGTSRINPLENDGVFRIRKTMEIHGIDALAVIGGDGTLSAARDLFRRGIPLVGIPKTIDNDICGTDRSFGFDTAVSTVTDAIDRLRTTAESHHRIIVVEVMGRDTGWIALKAGIAGGADEILVPEIPFTFGEVCNRLRARYEAGKKYSLVVIAEGVRAEAGTVPGDPEACATGKFMGIGTVLGRELEQCLGIETRVTTLGHVQRGGSPTADDRVLATRLGVAAVGLIRDGRFGRMAALQGDTIVSVTLEEAVERKKMIDRDLFELAMTVMGTRNRPEQPP